VGSQKPPAVLGSESLDTPMYATPHRQGTRSTLFPAFACGPRLDADADPRLRQLARKHGLIRRFHPRRWTECAIDEGGSRLLRGRRREQLQPDTWRGWRNRGRAYRWTVASGLKPPEALGAVLIFPLISFWLVALVGWTIYSGLRRNMTRPRGNAEESLDQAPEPWTS
jgi:hypothetical protein